MIVSLKAKKITSPYRPAFGAREKQKKWWRWLYRESWNKQVKEAVKICLLVRSPIHISED